MYKVIKAAAVSLRAKPWDKSHNADKMEKFIRLAARKRPDLVVLPEGVLEGYCVAEVVHPRRADEFATLAEPIDGPCIRRFRPTAEALSLLRPSVWAEKSTMPRSSTAAATSVASITRWTWMKAIILTGVSIAWDPS